MGDAYRGLTIRIGADAQPLNRALSSITSAARSTSKEVSRITRALKQDPGNTNLIGLQIRALGDESKSTATQVALLQRSIKETLSGYKGGKGNLSVMLKDAESNAANAKRQFNSLDAALEGVYDTIKKYNVAVNGMSDKDATAALRKLQAEARNSKDEVAMLEKELRRVWSADKSLIPFDTRSVDEAIAKWKELRIQQQKTQREMEHYGKFAGLKNQVVDLELAQSHLKQLRLEAINARNAMEQLGSSKGARNAASQQRLLAESTKEAENSLRSMMGIAKSMPKSLEAASMQARSFEQVTRLLNQQIRITDERLKTLDGSKVSKMEREFVSTGNAVRVLTDRAAGLEREIESVTARMAALKEHMAALPAGSAEFQRCDNEVRELNSKLGVTEGKLARVNAKLRDANKAHAFRTAQQELATLNGQLASHEMLMAKANKRWGQLGANIRTAGYSMSATLGGAAMIGGMYAIQAATDIDSAYRNMRKTVNGTEEQFEQLKRAAFDFSQTHFTSAAQILEIEAIGGQLGIQVTNLEKFAEVVSNIDIATNLDTETISQNLGQLSNIMNDMNQNLETGPGSMEAFGDALVRLGNNTAAQEDKIQNVMMRIASMGTICGMSTPDLLALASATAATGQGAEAAGTALSKTFSGIESAVNGSERALRKLRESGDLTEEEIEELNDAIEAGQGKLEAFAEVAGMSADEFKTAWNEAPMDAFQAFINGLKRIDEEGGSVDSTLTGLKITSVRQKQTLQGLTQTVGILGNAITMSNDAWNGVSDQWGAAGDAAREAQRKAEGFSGQLEMLKNNAKVLASVFLESLTPVLAGGVDVLRGLVDAFSDLPDGMKAAIAGVTALTAFSGPLMIFGGSVMQVGSNMKGFVTGQKKGWSVTRSALADGGEALLYASTMLDRNGNAIAKNGKLADRLGGKLVNAGAKVEAFGNKNLKAGGMVSKLGTGVGSLGVAMSSATISAGTLAAIVGVLGGVVVGSAMYVDSLTAKTREAKEANDKLADSSSKLASTAERAFAQMGGAIGSSLTVSLDDALSSYQTFAEKVSSSNLELASSADDMATKVLAIRESSQDAITIMGKLKDSGSLTELEYEQLSLSIDKYNQTTNDSIQLMRDEDGSIKVLRDGVDLTADSFANLAKQKENAARAEYFQKEYNTAFENNIEASKQVQTLQKQYDDAVAAKESFERSMRPNDTDSWEVWQSYNVELAKLEDKVNSSAEALRGANGVLDESAQSMRYASEMSALLNSELAKTEGTFENLVYGNSDAQAAFAATQNSVYDFKAILEKSGVSVDKLKNKDLAKMVREWDGSMPDLINAFKELNLVTAEQAEELSKLNLITIDDKSYFVNEDGSIQWQEEQLHDLQEFVIDDKHYYVTDDGSVYDQEGKCDGFDFLAINDKHYMVTDDGTVMDEQGKCDWLNFMVVNDKHYMVTNDGTVYDQQGQLQALQNFQLDGKTLYVTSDGLMTAEGELYAFDQLGIDPKEYLVDDDGTVRVAEDKLDSLTKKINDVPDVKVKATIDDSQFNSAYANIKNKINGLNGGQINFTARLNEANAAGGFKRMAAQKNIAIHAAGAFITNGTTYIGSDSRGVHHIAGEAGREFVQHHADGTTSIIPIQNRKYMAPFVAAVAEMLPEYGGVSRDDLYKAADAVVKSNRQQGDIVLVLDDREIGRVVRRFAS